MLSVPDQVRKLDSEVKQLFVIAHYIHYNIGMAVRKAFLSNVTEEK